LLVLGYFCYLQRVATLLPRRYGTKLNKIRLQISGSIYILYLIINNNKEAKFQDFFCSSICLVYFPLTTGRWRVFFLSRLIYIIRAHTS
jgi:hypothetical protein